MKRSYWQGGDHPHSFLCRDLCLYSSCNCVPTMVDNKWLDGQGFIMGLNIDYPCGECRHLPSEQHLTNYPYFEARVHNRILRSCPFCKYLGGDPRIDNKTASWDCKACKQGYKRYGVYLMFYPWQ